MNISNDHNEHDKAAKQKIIEDVEKYGYHLGLIEADNYLPAFVYSIGLFKTYGHPEIICFGLKPEVMSAILNHAADLIKKGESLKEETFYTGFLEGYSIKFLAVKKEFYSDYVGYAGWFNNMSFDFPLLQLVWPDKQYNFPWDEEFNPNWKFRQPLLDRDTDFKFFEERNLGVYTTKQALNGDPILYAYHNENGDWQFHTSDNPKLEDAILVCLEEIVKLDSCINELYHLQYGWKAWRENKEGEWEFEESSDEDLENK